MVPLNLGAFFQHGPQETVALGSYQVLVLEMDSLSQLEWGVGVLEMRIRRWGSVSLQGVIEVQIGRGPSPSVLVSKSMEVTISCWS